MVCLATATHTSKWPKITRICLICDQTLANFDVSSNLAVIQPASEAS